MTSASYAEAVRERQSALRKDFLLAEQATRRDDRCARPCPPCRRDFGSADVLASRSLALAPALPSRRQVMGLEMANVT